MNRFRTQTSKSLLVTVALLLAGSIVFAGGGKENETVAPPDITIHEAVVINDLKAVEQHIAAGTDINAKDDYGSTPLIAAATFGNTDSAILLIDAGADHTIPNEEGSSPLFIASFFCRKEIVEKLLEAGVDKNAENLAGQTALDVVSGPFEQIKPVYEGIESSLAPFGFRLDYEYLEKTRPVIAELIRS